MLINFSSTQANIRGSCSNPFTEGPLTQVRKEIRTPVYIYRKTTKGHGITSLPPTHGSGLGINYRRCKNEGKKGDLDL